MARKILILFASPRPEGNTAIITKEIVQSAESTGAEVTVVDVTRLTYRANGCTACMGCQKSDRFECVIKDEASEILAKIPQYDTLIFATPLYFFGPSAQLKLLTDRMYSLFKFDAQKRTIHHNLHHMRFGLIATAGGEKFEALKRTFEIMADSVGVEFECLLIPFTSQMGQVQGNEKALRAAQKFGLRMASLKTPHKLNP